MRRYHRLIQRAINEFGEAHLHEEVSSISPGGETLQITHRTKPTLAPITFKPDVVFTLSNRSKVAFQVLGTQASKSREVEADVLRAILCNGISKQVFIVPSASDLEKVSATTEIIQDVLDALGVRENLNLILTLLIPKDIKSSSAAMEYLNFGRFARQVFRDSQRP